MAIRAVVNSSNCRNLEKKKTKNYEKGLNYSKGNDLTARSRATADNLPIQDLKAYIVSYGKY